MHPAGCFGSSLAYDAKSATCVGCPKRTECAALVDNRRPLLLQVLDKFSDGQGRTMAWPWLTSKERAQRRELEREKAAAFNAGMTVGDAAAELKARMNKAAHTTFDKLMGLRLDPRSAPLDSLAKATPELGAVIGALRQQPQTARWLADEIALDCDIKTSTARLYAQALTSLLIVCGRAQRDGPIIRLV